MTHKKSRQTSERPGDCGVCFLLTQVAKDKQGEPNQTSWLGWPAGFESICLEDD